jgi:hypothetical protein
VRRFVNKVQHGHRVHVTYIGSIQRNGIAAPFSYTGGLNCFLQVANAVVKEENS